VCRQDVSLAQAAGGATNHLIGLPDVRDIVALRENNYIGSKLAVNDGKTG
jgi:hypothetical protein